MTTRLLTMSSRKAGKAPGTLVHVGERRVDRTTIDLVHYSQEHLTEKKDIPVAALRGFLDQPGVAWFNVVGIHDQETIQGIGDLFRIHPLALEDIMHSEQRPKLEEFDDYIFIVLKMVFLDSGRTGVRVEQVSLILGSNYVISLQEAENGVFESLHQRIRTGKGRMRRMGADYLAYAIMDAIVDHYFGAVEELGEVVEALEDTVVLPPKRETLRTIQRIKRQMLAFRRSVWPLREAVSLLQRTGGPLLSEDLSPFLRDLYDHTIQVMDSIETLHITIAEAMDLYMSSINNRMNEVAQVLTILATIFMPLTLIAGIYGMNFKYMPELDLPWAYPAVLLSMALIAAGMLYFFKRRRWIFTGIR